MNRSIARAALAASLLFGTTAVVGIAGIAPSFAASTPSVSKAVSPALMEAQKAAVAGDWPTALAAIKTAQAVSDRKPYDDYVINKMLVAVAANMKDYPTAETAEEAVVASEFFASETDDAKKQTLRSAFALAAQLEKWDRTVAFGQQLEAMGPLDPQFDANMAVAYYNLKNDAMTKQYAQKAIDAAKAAGQTPPEVAVNLMLDQGQKGDTGTLEKMATDYNNPAVWGNLVNTALTAKGVSQLDGLYLFRLKYVAGGMAGSDDYLSYADIAADKYFYVEARTVLNDGIAKGKVTRGQAAPILNRSANGAQLDQSSLGATAAKAKAAKSGNEDTLLAEDYFGYGRYADAEEAARRAMSKGGVKEPGEAQIVLAQSLIAQHKGYDEAARVLSQVSAGGNRGKVVHLWTIYAQTQQKHAGTAAGQ